MYYEIRPNDAVLKEAEDAGRRDGRRQPPPRGQATQWLEGRRAAQEAQTESMLKRRNDQLNRGELGAIQELRTSKEHFLITCGILTALVDQLDHEWALNLRLHRQLEQLYLDSAETEWLAQGHIFDIPRYQDRHDEVLAEMRGRLESLRNRAGSERRESD
ncbi:MAG: hypothetical protein ACOYEV_00990 [Candidatus Nanopelagicales bacterium]